MPVIDAWDDEAVERSLDAQGVPHGLWRDMLKAGSGTSAGSLDESGPKAVNRAAHAYYNNRINALVALCEEIIEELAMFAAIVSERYDVGEYRARLAALKGQE